MDAQGLTVWSMALGAIAAVALARIADLLARPSLSQVQGVAYHIAVFLLVLILSGVAEEAAPGIDPRVMQAAQVLAGPVCVGLSDLWIRGWLNAGQRDRTMAAALRWSANPLAPVMAAGCLLTLPAIAGRYALAMKLPGMSLPWQSLAALCAALCNGFTGFVLWRRDRHERRGRSGHQTPLPFDPVTQLHSGASLVHKLIRAQQRRRHTRRDGAVLAVMVFDGERILEQLGTAALNEMYVCMAGRIQRQVGVVNLVGRYYDRCFVALVETIRSPAWLRTLGLRVASSLRRPMELTSRSGHCVEISADVGVGVVHLRPGFAAVEDILHEAQRMAEAGRTMRSRAAIWDRASATAVPVEQVDLGGRRHGRPHGASRTH